MCRIAIFFMNWNFRYFPTALLINHWPYLKCTGACFYHQMWNSLYMYILLKVLDSTHSFEIALMYYLQPFTLAGDLTNEDFVRQLVDDTVKHYGKLDILVGIVDLIWFEQILLFKTKGSGTSFNKFFKLTMFSLLTVTVSFACFWLHNHHLLFFCIYLKQPSSQ